MNLIWKDICYLYTYKIAIDLILYIKDILLHQGLIHNQTSAKGLCSKHRERPTSREKANDRFTSQLWGQGPESHVP